jgi:hypothetical protein
MPVQTCQDEMRMARFLQTRRHFDLPKLLLKFHLRMTESGRPAEVGRRDRLAGSGQAG